MSKNKTNDTLSPISSGEESDVKSSSSEEGEWIAGSPTQLDELPSAVKRRVFALKKLQFQINQIEEEFSFAFLELQKSYELRYESLFQKRNQIVCGDYEPLDSDLAEGEYIEALPTEVKGIPNFWLIVLLRSEDFSDFIQEYDEPILKHLVDIKSSYDTHNKKMSFEFEFEPNDYFKNKVLVKDIFLSSDPEQIDIVFPIKCRSPPIEWNEGKDVTQEVTDAPLQPKSANQLKTICQKKSFFRFFETSSLKKDSEENELSLDWCLGKKLLNDIIPYALYYYTGDLGMSEDDEDSDSDGLNEEQTNSETDSENDQ